MPWIFKATWSIIKAFLSEKQKQWVLPEISVSKNLSHFIFRMVNFTSLSEFEKEVTKDNWLKVIGGSLPDMQLDGAAPMPAELGDLCNSLKFWNKISEPIYIYSIYLHDCQFSFSSQKVFYLLVLLSASWSGTRHVQAENLHRKSRNPERNRTRKWSEQASGQKVKVPRKWIRFLGQDDIS